MLQGLITRLRADPSASRIAELERRCTELRNAALASEAARAGVEAELRAAETRYLLALRGSQDGLWEWELASGVVRLSPRWKGMLGFDDDELPDGREGWWGRVHADDRDAFEQALRRHLADPGSRFDHELRLLHRSGRVVDVVSRGAAIRREDGTAYRMVGLDTDVTRVKRVLRVLDSVAEGTSGAFGGRFFARLVEHFARALEVDNAFITECADRPVTRLRTLAYWSARDGLRENFEYTLDGTPCAAVVGDGGRMCFHREGVAAMFPREAGFEAFLGVPIIGSDGNVLGHLAFRHPTRLGDEMLVESVYRIFVARAAAEIERLQALARLPSGAA